MGVTNPWHDIPDHFNNEPKKTNNKKYPVDIPCP